MLDMRISESEKIVYINVSGYIKTAEANKFSAYHKENTKKIKKSEYRLVVDPGVFECENDDDIKKLCTSFYKSGYKKIYLLDPNQYILKGVKLSGIEKKLFLKVAKLINNKSQIK